MRRTVVLNLPGNSTKEQTFYEHQAQPAAPGVEWPGSFELDAAVDQSTNGAPTRPDPSPFKLGGM